MQTLASPFRGNSVHTRSSPLLFAARQFNAVPSLGRSNHFRAFASLFRAIPSHSLASPFLDVSAHLLSAALHCAPFFSFPMLINPRFTQQFLFDADRVCSSLRPIESNLSSSISGPNHSLLANACSWLDISFPRHSVTGHFFAFPFPITSRLSFSHAYQLHAFPYPVSASLFFSLTVQGRSTLCRFLAVRCLSVPILFNSGRTIHRPSVSFRACSEPLLTAATLPSAMLFLGAANHSFSLTVLFRS